MQTKINELEDQRKNLKSQISKIELKFEYLEKSVKKLESN